jgi:mRNA interferase YafQ
MGLGLPLSLTRSHHPTILPPPPNPPHPPHRKKLDLLLLAFTLMQMCWQLQVVFLSLGYMNTTSIQLRIDAKTKREASKVFADLGMDISTGMKLYLRQVIREKSLPFRPGRTVNGFTPEYEQELLRELDWTLKHGTPHPTVKSALDHLWSTAEWFPMYTIFFAKKFIKAARQLERSGKFKKKEVDDVIALLASGNVLPANLRDHALSGDTLGQRECHVRGDVLLIYHKEKDILVLVAIDIGTHHELFGG